MKRAERNLTAICYSASRPVHYVPEPDLSSTGLKNMAIELFDLGIQ